MDAADGGGGMDAGSMSHKSVDSGSPEHGAATCTVQ